MINKKKYKKTIIKVIIGIELFFLCAFTFLKYLNEDNNYENLVLDNTVIEKTELQVLPTEAPEETMEEYRVVTEEVVEKESSSVDIKDDDIELEGESIALPVEIIWQYPDLPSGCEVTALTMVLNYYGINVTNYYLADNYLPLSSWDFYEGFVGDIYSDYAYCCYAPVVVSMANKYFFDNNINAEAVDVSGYTRESLLNYVYQGKPIIIWNTEGMSPTWASEIILDGHEVIWMENEHCMVLCGYNAQTDEVIIADSISGYVYRDADTFFEINKQIFGQAVLINIK